MYINFASAKLNLLVATGLLPGFALSTKSSLEKQIASCTFAAKFNIFRFYINNICQGN